MRNFTSKDTHDNCVNDTGLFGLSQTILYKDNWGLLMRKKWVRNVNFVKKILNRVTAKIVNQNHADDVRAIS